MCVCVSKRHFLAEGMVGSKKTKSSVRILLSPPGRQGPGPHEWLDLSDPRGKTGGAVERWSPPVGGVGLASQNTNTHPMKCPPPPDEAKVSRVSQKK